MACELVETRNRCFHRGGHCPYALAFESAPGLPHELLSDDPLCHVGLEVLRETAIDSDSVAAEFARQHERERRAASLPDVLEEPS